MVEGIEIFKKRFETDTGIIPIHIEDDISSLSAILLDENYYDLMTEGGSTLPCKPQRAQALPLRGCRSCPQMAGRTAVCGLFPLPRGGC